jgi:hypothetical protein
LFRLDVVEDTAFGWDAVKHAAVHLDVVTLDLEGWVNVFLSDAEAAEKYRQWVRSTSS